MVNKQENPSVATYNWEDKVILIVEDDMINYKFLEMTIRRTQAKVIWAKNGLEGVNMVIANPEIDLILMDIQMPIMNGYEATTKIKSMKPDIPIIAQTAFALNNEGNDVYAAGCDYYLKKPINPFVLLSLLKDIIDAK